MTKLYSIKKYKDYLFLLIFIFILINSIILKFSYIKDIYTEYDDIGVISLHKGNFKDKEINILNFSFEIKKETIKNLNNSFLHPLYIAAGWTYAPGQYFIVPFLNLENKKYYSKILSVRAISSITSLLNSILIIYMCIKILNINRWLGLLIFSIFTFSLNSNIYSNHMSPYSTYSFCTTLGIFICIKATSSKNYLKFYTFNSILIYFSYTNILFYLGFLYIEFRKKRIKKTFYDLLTQNKKYLILNILLLLPILFLILFKLTISKAGIRGASIDPNLNFFELIEFIYCQFILSINSIQTGFLPINFQKINLFFIILLLFIGIFYSYKKIILNSKIILEFLILYFLVWIFLYFFNKVPIDQTRHALIYFPIYLFILGIILKEIRYVNILSVILIIALIFPAIKNNHEILKSKKSNFNYDLIIKEKIKKIYTFSDTLSPFLYFDNDYQIFNLDLNNFRENFKKEDLPKNLLIVSQNQSLEERSSYDEFLRNFINFYNITIVEENYSSTFMTYNNYEEHSTENGFYLYNLNKKQ